MTTSEKDDKDLNNYLKGDSEISNRYRASNTGEPPSHLDEKILSAAKEAVTDKPPTSRIKFHKAPWVKPVSVAAIITLSVSLVVTMQQQTGEPLISEPTVEIYDAAVLSDEEMMPQSMTAADAMSVKNEAEIKQSSDKDSSDIVPDEAALGAVGGYRALQKSDRAKIEVMERADKKMMLKEEVRSEIPKAKIMVKERLLQSVPAEAELDTVMKFKREPQLRPQEEILLKIKSLWEQGKQEEAKEMFKQFVKNNPYYSERAIEEVIGDELFELIKVE